MAELVLLSAGSGHLPEVWAVIPFIALLLLIATGPLFFPHFWERYYPLIAILMGAPVVIYYLKFLGDYHMPLHTAFEYFSFISLIGSLFVAASGILIRVEGRATPLANAVFLAIGGLVANIIGTTGASILLIRPFIRMNRERIHPYHIAFFIFIIANCGGCLTPIGDPPLFLGFLKGVPFFWTLANNWYAWLFVVGLLCVVFYFIDRRNYRLHNASAAPATLRFSMRGYLSLVWLLVILLAVFLDPAIFEWLPAIEIEGNRFSFIRELIMVSVGVLAYITADREALKGNDFNFDPIKEVGFLFFGIFATMMPALQLISHWAHSPQGMALVNPHTLYWITGSLSSVLDNAPTYLNFLAAGMGKYGLDINNKAQVLEFVRNYPLELQAVSLGAVFFGAMTYIGNAPNFMVKNIAEQSGIDMPQFVGYVVRYSLGFLLPVLLIAYLGLIAWRV